MKLPKAGVIFELGLNGKGLSGRVGDEDRSLEAGLKSAAIRVKCYGRTVGYENKFSW